MHRHPKGSRPVPWTSLALAAAALAACVPAALPTAVATPNAIRTNTAAPMETSTQTPTPVQSAAPTPEPPPDIAVTITYVRMMDATTGWAEGQVEADGTTRILRTTDGGETWGDVSPVTTGEVRISFLLDGQLAWVWSWDSGRWRTQDGGQSWTSLEDRSSSHDIWFNDSQHGWRLDAEVWGLSFVQFDIVSFSTTEDGGQSWVERTPPPGGGSAYMAFPDTQTAWALRAGFAKVIEGFSNLFIPFHVQTTFDRGSTWTTREMPLPEGTYRVEREYEGTYLGGTGNCGIISPVYSSTTIWKAALICEKKSWLYTSANQGRTWIISPMPAGRDADVQFASPTVGWLFVSDWEDRQGRLYKSTDGGQTWALIKRTGWVDIRMNFVDAQTGWAVACAEWFCYNSDAVRALVKTVDGGQTWQTLAPHLVP